MTLNLTDKALFCLNYLYHYGFFQEEENKEQIGQYLDTHEIPNYRFVKEAGVDFFVQLATEMRKLWPTGEKDGKWPWKDTVSNLSKRLSTVWKIRNLEGYTIDECLRAARQYIAQFENDRKYMKILKKFILTQSTITEPDGRIRIVNESKFADILESLPRFVPDESSDVTELSLFEQGELI